ncbi:aldo/keto reductase [Caulobacter sp. S45]|uniref:aldo/keto reductase n=1 Tax=Caulobacter sp. S45 TaxID=1641861 RepID=UPI001575E470|nr:aldo/keto reductase [Caulobacter sp. S45]
MRYRPYTSTGLSSSAITLSLRAGQTAAQAHRLTCAALELGVNSFSFAAGDIGAAEALRQAVAVAGRRVLIVMLRLDLDGPPFERQVRTALAASGATYLDALMLDQPAPGVLTRSELAELEAVRQARLTTRLALAGDALTTDEYLPKIDFDVLAIRYNICSGWPERNLLKHAAQRGMTILGYGPHIDAAEPTPSAPVIRGLARLIRRPHMASPEVYAFLDQTRGWTGPQITLGYALTEPGLASVIVEPDSPQTLESLAEAVERELPAGVAAQIEIARFAATARQSVA